MLLLWESCQHAFLLLLEKSEIRIIPYVEGCGQTPTSNIPERARFVSCLTNSAPQGSPPVWAKRSRTGRSAKDFSWPVREGTTTPDSSRRNSSPLSYCRGATRNIASVKSLGGQKILLFRFVKASPTPTVCSCTKDIYSDPRKWSGSGKSTGSLCFRHFWRASREQKIGRARGVPRIGGISIHERAAIAL